MLKMITFNRKGPFEIKAHHDEDGLALGSKDLGTYRIEVPVQTENKRIKVKTKMTLNGMFTIESAQLVEDEEYEETVKEKRELPSETPAAEGEKPDGDTPPAAEEAEKKYEYV